MKKRKKSLTLWTHKDWFDYFRNYDEDGKTYSSPVMPSFRNFKKYIGGKGNAKKVRITIEEL